MIPVKWIFLGFILLLSLLKINKHIKALAWIIYALTVASPLGRKLILGWYALYYLAILGKKVITWWWNQ